MTRELLVVGNASAGQSDRQRVRAAAGRLAESCPVRLEWTEDPADLDELVKRCDAERIVSAGGDGSISALVSAIHRAGRDDLEVAVLPAGTGNDLAGSLGLSDMDDAIAAACGDRVERMDLIETSHGVAVNALHLGIGALAARKAAALKGTLGRVAYPAGALMTGLGPAAWPMWVEVDGETVAEGLMTLVALTNGYRVGGGFPLAPGADPEDGTIDVVVAEATGLAGRARLAWFGRQGRLGEDPAVQRAEGRHVQVTVDGQVAANRDGELFDVEGVLEARVLPHVLPVCLTP